MADPITANVYVQNGYSNRQDYLDSLREEYGQLVDILITVLPASEDFDGLVTELDDAMHYDAYTDLI